MPAARSSQRGKNLHISHHNERLVVLALKFGAAVLGVQDSGADSYSGGDILAIVLATRAHSNNLCVSEWWLVFLGVELGGGWGGAKGVLRSQAPHY